MHGINFGLGRTWPVRRALGASASFNFLGAVLPPSFTYSRASVATDVINGVLTQFSSGQPRLSAANGYLSESARTNNLRNAQAGGSTVGVIGSGGAFPTNWTDTNTVGLTREIIGSGTINGFSYIDVKLSGTPSAGSYDLLFDAATQVIAASGQIWTGSFYIGLIGGSLTGITTIAARVSGRASGAETEGTSQMIVPTIDPTRFFAIRPLNNGSTTHVVAALSVAVTALPVNATFRIAACQLEQGYGVSSYIPTTTAAVTRAADSLYILSSNVTGWINPGSSALGLPGTVIVTAKTAPWHTTIDQSLFTWVNMWQNDYVRLVRSQFAPDRLRLRILKNYGLPVDANINDALLDNQEIIAGCSWKTNMAIVTFNGAPPAVDSTMPDMPSTDDRLWIGSNDATGGHFFGYIKKMDFYNSYMGTI